MQVVPLTAEALEFRLREEPGVEREWFTARMKNYIEYDPSGCFALVDRGEPVGMVTAVCYQTVGWLGWLYVAEARRGKGLGEQLMRQGMGYCIGRGMRTIVLEAVVEAVPLYTRVGFRRQFRTQHYRIEKGELRRTEPVAGLVVRRVRGDDWAGIAALDARMFHQDRSRMLGILMANPLFGGWAAERKGQIAGYLLATEAGANRQVGPLAVDPQPDMQAAVAAQLCAAAFAESEKPLVVRCPLATDDRAGVLVELGARPIDYHTERMYAGEAYAAEEAGVLCLGCPGKGWGELIL